MQMINEIGRRVMQGGSRRSAIYASLNWKHKDINEFLNAKNWDDMQIGGTDLTMGDLKKKDFNFPCPLDMTNISVNYDTEWLLNYWKWVMSLGIIYVRLLEQENRDSVLISLTRKRKHFVMPVLKLAVLMIVMYAILAVLT
jgi:ribonucleoside-diphosphate reductase alpha chain